MLPMPDLRKVLARLQVLRSKFEGLLASPKEGGARSRSTRPPPDTAARTDGVWCKSWQPSYVCLRSRTPAAQGAISHRAAWLHSDLRRVRSRHRLVVAR